MCWRATPASTRALTVSQFEGWASFAARYWTEANVSGAGTDWIAELEHPAQSGYVSLRAAAIDADDNLVELKIIRAYRVE